MCTAAICQPATCSDGVKNQFESDVDCGFGCPLCDAGRACDISEDCASYVCVNGSCQTSTCTDGLMNGQETGVDCGGTCAPCVVCSHDITLAWDAPFTHSDGTCVTDLAGYTIHWGAASQTYTELKKFNLGDPELTCQSTGEQGQCGPATTCSAKLTNLANGTWYFAVTAFDANALESGYSNEATTTINCP